VKREKTMISKKRRLNSVQKTQLIEKEVKCSCKGDDRCLRCLALEIIATKDKKIQELKATTASAVSEKRKLSR
jgi:hypothetical protein